MNPICLSSISREFIKAFQQFALNIIIAACHIVLRYLQSLSYRVERKANCLT